MPVPQGQITTSEMMNPQAEPPLPEEPTEVEQQEEVREDDLQ
jgi:hypothetical protein